MYRRGRWSAGTMDGGGRSNGAWRRRIGLYAGPILFLVIVILPEPQSMIDGARSVGAEDRAPLIAVALLAWVLVWWITECVPLGLAGLLVPLVLGIAGIIAWRAALAAFMDPIIWIFMAGFVLAAAFRKWDLDRRIALGLASLYKGDNPVIATLFVACLPVFVLTLTGSITASTTVVFPFLIAYLAMLGVGTSSRYAEASMLALAQAATAGAMLLLISTAPNLVAKGTIAQFVPGYHFTFFDWFIVGTPHAFIGLFISWGVTFFFIRPEMKRLSVDREKLAKARRELGAMSRGETTVLALLLVAIALWLLPSVARALAEADPSFTETADLLAVRVPESMPAVLVILGAGLIRVKGEPVLRWREIVEGIDWNIVFLFGGGIALAMGLVASGSAEWLAGQVSDILGARVDAWTIFVASALLGFGLSYAASNTASALVACPLAATLALGAGLNPIPPILAAALACSISSAIPSTTPPMAIVYSSGHVRIWDMFRVGIVSDLLRLGALVAIGPFLVDLIL